MTPLLSHLDAEKVAQLHLFHIVANILIVIETSAIDIGIVRSNRGIRL